MIVDYKYLFWMNDPESESFKIEKSKVGDRYKTICLSA